MSWPKNLFPRFNSEAEVTTTSERIIVTMPKEDPPEFERVYEAMVQTSVGRFAVKIRRYTSRFSGRTDHYGELRQGSGSYILFDPQNVADKIIDRELYPKVQAVIDRMLEMDRKFVESNPCEFTDSRGVTWQKK